MNHPSAQTPEPVATVTIGGPGVLPQRRLSRALYRLFSEGAISSSLAIVGMSRRGMTHEQFRTFARDGVGRDVAIDAASWNRFAERLFYVSADSMKEADYAHMARTLAAVEPRFGTGGNRLFYLASPPSTYEPILTNLGRSELIRYGSRQPWTRVIIEKPFGRDEATARRLNVLVDRAIGEESVYRIDHYLGKETVQNMLVFRFANTVFEPVWNRRYVDHIQISFVEDMGVGGRGRFYEEVGVVLRQPPLRLFRDYDITGMDHNVLVLKTTDDERIALRFGARVPGHKHEIRSVTLDFSYRDFGEPEHSAYEHLLLDVMRGVQTSFPRRDEVELQWAIVDPLLQHWADHPPEDFPNYPAGSMGSADADALLMREGRQWRTD